MSLTEHEDVFCLLPALWPSVDWPSKEFPIIHFLLCGHHSESLPACPMWHNLRYQKFRVYCLEKSPSTRSRDIVQDSVDGKKQASGAGQAESPSSSALQ